MDYLDFDVELTHEAGRDYQVTVRSPAGEASEPMRFPYDEVALELALVKLQNALLRSGGPARRALTDEEKAVYEFGRTLFEALMTGEVRARYAVSRARANQEEKGLRVRLHIEPPDLAALPWEYLYDPSEGDYLCLLRSTSLVRYLNLPHSREPLVVAPPLRILGLVASPDHPSVARLDTEVERRRLEQALSGLIKRALVELHWLEGHTWRDLQQAMWPGRGPWHMLHFIGHGGFNERSEEGMLALETEGGGLHLLSATHLGRVLRDHRALRLVLLNACEGAKSSKRDRFSSVGATLARAGIPAVLAMQYEITDRAALELTRTFYEALAGGLPVDAALTEARLAINIGIHNSLEWGTPVLFLRASEGTLFRLEGAPPPLVMAVQPNPPPPALAALPANATPMPEREAETPLEAVAETKAAAVAEAEEAAAESVSEIENAEATGAEVPTEEQAETEVAADAETLLVKAGEVFEEALAEIRESAEAEEEARAGTEAEMPSATDAFMEGAVVAEIEDAAEELVESLEPIEAAAGAIAETEAEAASERHGPVAEALVVAEAAQGAVAEAEGLAEAIDGAKAEQAVAVEATADQEGEAVAVAETPPEALEEAEVQVEAARETATGGETEQAEVEVPAEEPVEAEAAVTLASTALAQPPTVVASQAPLLLRASPIAPASEQVSYPASEQVSYLGALPPVPKISPPPPPSSAKPTGFSLEKPTANKYQQFRRDKLHASAFTVGSGELLLLGGMGTLVGVFTQSWPWAVGTVAVLFLLAYALGYRKALSLLPLSIIGMVSGALVYGITLSLASSHYDQVQTSHLWFNAVRMLTLRHQFLAGMCVGVFPPLVSLLTWLPFLEEYFGFELAYRAFLALVFGGIVWLMVTSLGSIFGWGFGFGYGWSFSLLYGFVVTVLAGIGVICLLFVWTRARTH